MKNNSPRNEWIARAQDDLQAVASLFADALYALACFHAQQCVEKALKAFLLQEENTIPKIHSLPELLVRCVKHEKKFGQFQESVEQLDKFYRPTRYPDAVAGILPEGWPGKREVERAKKDAEEIFEFVSKLLVR